MGDLPPMSACPYAKRGEHEMVVIARDGEDVVLFACCVCGAARRLSMTAAVPLDEMPASEIAALISTYGTYTR